MEPKKIQVSISISDYLGQNLVILSIKDIEILLKGKTSKSSLFHCFYTVTSIYKNSTGCKNSPKKQKKTHTHTHKQTSVRASSTSHALKQGLEEHITT
jgi:hypothetical protein